MGGVDPSQGNEGQKLVWELQDIKVSMNEKAVEKP